MKQVDVGREIKVKNICGSNVDLRPGLSIDFSTFLPRTSRDTISKSVSGAGFSIIFQKYRPLLTMSQKRENWNYFGSTGMSF